jgi:hypothetical protein
MSVYFRGQLTSPAVGYHLQWNMMFGYECLLQANKTSNSYHGHSSGWSPESRDVELVFHDLLNLNHGPVRALGFADNSDLVSSAAGGSSLGGNQRYLL